MNVFLLVVISSLLGVVAYQDFRYRAVSWIVFPLLFVAGIFEIISKNGLELSIEFFFINLLIIALQFTGVILFFSFKNRKLVNITDHYIGWGDILLIISTCTLFSPANFMVFYVFSLFCTLIAHMIYSTLVNNTRNIPLAGVIAFLLIIVIFGNIALEYDLYNDEWITLFLF